jgi:F-type H+-transporting ATPase subunit b
MAEGGGLLSLDPAVLALQVVAFAILFLVLRRFLFRPLLGVMEQREKEIADALRDGERVKQELARLDQERDRVLVGAREEGRQQVRMAVQEGEQARDRIVKEARDEAQQIRQHAREVVELEREEAMLKLRNQMVDLALLAARKAVLSPLDEAKHRQAVDAFITTLEQQQ